MTSLDTRISLLARLGHYLQSDAPEWEAARRQAVAQNSWFLEESIQQSADAIATRFLDQQKLRQWVSPYSLPAEPRTVGIVMAGNIPLVGFHDFLCGFLAGHNLRIKCAARDLVLFSHLLNVLRSWDAEAMAPVQLAERLNGSDAFIATGSNNSARYFEQYFGAKPHLIRQSRTSVAVLTGEETEADWAGLRQDVFQYFGLGCRNVTQLWVPRDYNFERLFQELQGSREIVQAHKYRNNYDYHLALYLLNKVPYMSNEDLLLVESEVPFSGVATLHYQYYDDYQGTIENLRNNTSVQAIVARGEIPFGEAQCPTLSDYADGVDTMAFMCAL
jgi:hypothetical protein